MNYKLIANGAGIFSIFMDFVIMNIYDVPNVENLYVEVTENDYGIKSDAFNFVFNQEFNESYQVINCTFKEGGFRKKGMGWGAIENCGQLAIINEACWKFKIKKEILDSITAFPNCLGIHYRGEDMNKKHPIYGRFNYDSYKHELKKVLKSEQVQTIFIASDNYETIHRFIVDFGKDYYIYSYVDFIRCMNEKEDSEILQIKNANNEKFWHEAFIDMLTLASCKYMLCRTSNFSNAAIAFSDTLTKIYRL